MTLVTHLFITHLNRTVGADVGLSKLFKKIPCVNLIVWVISLIAIVTELFSHF